MAVQPADLLTPRGRLDPRVIWPTITPEVVTETLVAYLTEAEIEAAAIPPDQGHDKAVKAWGYYRAKAAQYDALTGLPTTVEDRDEGSSSYLPTQLTLIRDERDGYLAEFQGLLDEATAVASVLIHPPASASVATTFRW